MRFWDPLDDDIANACERFENTDALLEPRS